MICENFLQTVSGKDAVDSAMGMLIKISNEVILSVFYYNVEFFTAWQVCIDETTGYTYYWNMVTNQVTWDMPPEYAAYENMAQQYDSTGFTGNNILLHYL